MRRSSFFGWTLSVLTLLHGCAPASDGEITEPRAGADGEVTQAQTTLAPAETQRDAVVLVIEQGPQSLSVKSSSRVQRSKLGPQETWNGVGTATHRWVLVGAAGATVAEGNIATRRGVHVAPSPEHPAAHADRDTVSFVVRALQPGAGEHIEIHTLDGSAPVLSWP